MRNWFPLDYRRESSAPLFQDQMFGRELDFGKRISEKEDTD